MEKNFGDDFEFKPLTEGLGFHKKVIDLQDEMGAIPLKTGILPKSKLTGEKIEGRVTEGFRPAKGAPSAIHPPQSSEKSLHNPWEPALKGKTIIENAAKASERKFSQIAVSWPAAFFDAAMILGLGLLFSAVVFALTKIDLNDLLSMLRDETGAQIASVLLVFAVFEIYCVICRSFFGKTLGEWAFDCQLGSLRDQDSLLYPIQVAWRTLLIAMTGFITLPILSTIFNRDLAGLLSGVSLKSENR